MMILRGSEWEAMGIIYDVRTGADSLKGEGITRAILWPGAGVGGHCLTKGSVSF